MATNEVVSIPNEWNVAYIVKVSYSRIVEPIIDCGYSINLELD